jgi:hypothetical protein
MEILMTRLSIFFASALVFASTLFAAAPPVYEVTTVAGTPGVAGNRDGDAHTALFNRPTWLDVLTWSYDFPAVNAGDIYVVDRVNQALRFISGNTVKTLPINPALTLNFGGPFGGGILIEPGSGGCGAAEYVSGLFVASSGSNRVPLMSFFGGLADRDGGYILGDGTAGQRDGDSRSAQLRNPTGIARSHEYEWHNLDQRYLYIADSDNHTIRRVRWYYSFEGCPDPAIMETFAGSPGTPGFRDGVGEARFNEPRGLATYLDGSIVVADSGNHVIRKVSSAGIVTTIAGVPGVPGSDDGPAFQAHLNTPSGLDVAPNGDIFITDTANHTIRLLSPDGQLRTIAGTPGLAGYADGFGPNARFSGPVGIHVAPDGTILVADTSNNVIRRLVATASLNHPRLIRP